MTAWLTPVSVMNQNRYVVLFYTFNHIYYHCQKWRSKYCNKCING
ncbi:hypothetical protein SXY01_21440 [Staphylococcus xylosus]|nr:hypothetical protein SXY01_21440 [Staphylococcus xylosus]